MQVDVLRLMATEDTVREILARAVDAAISAIQEDDSKTPDTAAQAVVQAYFAAAQEYSKQAIDCGAIPAAAP